MDRIQKLILFNFKKFLKNLDILILIWHNINVRKINANNFRKKYLGRTIKMRRVNGLNLNTDSLSPVGTDNGLDCRATKYKCEMDFIH